MDPRERPSLRRLLASLTRELLSFCYLPVSSDGLKFRDYPDTRCCVDGYSAYMEATGATEDETTGLLTISSTDYDNLESLFFNIGGVCLRFAVLRGRLFTLAALPHI